MIIPDSIIEKLQLKESAEQVGNSFMQNLRIFLSELPDLNGFRFLECDMLGKPCKDITVYNKTDKRVSVITPEFVQDANLQVVIRIIKSL